ncbi:hypothetical protein [Tersicoccus sp. Bi-70]|uniref:hypothetical protein n=1 Tax=Tersicoccus sp. Bi-70 TaxID=1897634 RepID=UPI000977525F|nr:hypothetical protein [Tersicoccus sp. Bi-70]OMH36636.1 hypothetical protein BGP79_12535 [Tersicoccus sp. Bi-70]
MIRRRGASAAAGPVAAAAPVPSVWLPMLRLCLLVCVPLAVVVAVAGAVIAGWGAAGSALGSAVLVMAFFAISLLVGHRFESAGGTRALRAFLVTYVVKVIGFGAVLVLIGRPGWVDPAWFVGSAVATLIAWQVAELAGFARSRRLYLP